MNKTIQIQVPEGKVAEWQEIDGKTILVAVDEVDNRPVTERIKTFEDAVEATGMTLPFDDYQLSYLPKDVVAYMKLRIIAAALNELHETTLNEFPKFTTDEYRWYPWFCLYTQKDIDNMDEKKKEKLWLFCSSSSNGSYCGLAFARSSNSWSHSSLSARLAVKSEELAKYFGQQFIDIWSDYVALSRKEEQCCCHTKPSHNIGDEHLTEKSDLQ